MATFVVKSVVIQINGQFMDLSISWVLRQPGSGPVLGELGGW